MSIASPVIRAGTLRASLRPRVIGRAEALPEPCWMGVLLEGGAARFNLGDRTETVAAPALIWRPWRKTASVSLDPGSIGAFAIVGPSIVASAIGHRPESREIRNLVETECIVSLKSSAATRGILATCFASLTLESESQTAGSDTLLESYLRIILIELWRAQPEHARVSGNNSPSHSFFSQFTSLVETRFRERWTVADYAQQLGMSRDRLGDICSRVRNLGPKEIIDRRTEREARLLLHHSPNTIDQIAALLGFHSTAQFNRFMRRMSGLPPGRLRKRLTEAQTKDEEQDAPLPYEWP